MFINTRAARQVFKCIKANSCVTIIASFGVGKTFTLRHVALQMADDEYDVILVTNPDEILKFNNPNMKTLFVVDDLCGNFSVDQSNIKSWEPVVDDIKNILDNSNIKILAACRLQIYRDVKFESLSIFKTCVCNLLSKKYSLSKSEKQAIAEVYLKTKAHEITEYLNLYDCFPLLCKMCYDVPKLNVKLFFKNPCSIYESEIHNLFMKGCYSKYCALALCVMFNNRLKEELLTNDLNEGTRTIIANTCEACRLASGTSRLLLQDELEILKGTFIKRDQNMYKVINDKIFDFLCHFYGQNLIRCVIKNAEICLIKEIYILQKDDDKDQLITIKKSKYQQMYMQRMIHDWSMGNNHDIFNHKNTTSHLFREQFVLHFKALDTSSMIKLKYIQDMAESSETNFKNDENDYDLSAILINCCLSGNISLVQWCCNLGVDVNKCDSNGQSPFMKACVKGDTEIVIFLLSRGIDFKKCDKYNQSPVMMTCKHGHSEILRILLKSGTGYNKRDINDQSLFMIACGNGHKDIVKLLLEKEADYDICNKENWSPLMMACQQGHVEIVEMLIDRGVNYTRYTRSPLIIAYKKGHRKIVQILLDKESANQECVKLNGEKKKDVVSQTRSSKL